MAHFYGKIQGAASGEPASRLGTKKSGLTAVAASWAGAVHVVVGHDDKTGTDTVHVSLIPWHGAGVSRVLYEGPISGASERSGLHHDTPTKERKE
jgi:hypothetical protein